MIAISNLTRQRVVQPLCLPKHSVAVHRRCFSISTASHEKNALLVDETNAGVLELTLNRPQRRNSLNENLLCLLKAQLDRAKNSPNKIRAVLLQSESKAAGMVFSSGHHLKELQQLDESQQAQLFQLSSDVMELLSTGIPQPTICAVDGLATAAGCQLVAACDMVVASPLSLYSTPGASTIGLFCHTPAVPLVKCIGIKRATDMLYTGRVITAQEALEYGLISRVAGNPVKEARKVAEQISSQSSAAMQLGKKTLFQQRDAATLKDAYTLANKAMVANLKSKDAQSGIQAFINKEEPPNWEHR